MSGGEGQERLRSIHDPRYLELIAALRAERTRRGLTQAEVASRLGRSQPFLAKTERGERRLDLVETLELCSVLGIKLVDVVPREFAHLLADASKDSPAASQRIA